MKYINSKLPNSQNLKLYIRKIAHRWTFLERLWLQRTPAETTDTFCLHVASLKAITTQILSTFLGAYTWTLWQKYFWNRILIVISLKKIPNHLVFSLIHARQRLIVIGQAGQAALYCDWLSRPSLLQCGTSEHAHCDWPSRPSSAVLWLAKQAFLITMRNFRACAREETKWS